MTEAEWLASEDWLALTNCLSERSAASRFSDRVCRLFAAACARRVWEYLVSDRSRAAVELSDRAADHPVPSADLRAAWGNADEAVYELNDLPERDPRIWAAYTASDVSRPHLAIDQIFDVGIRSGGIGDGGMKATADLLREVFGNPFRPTTLVVVSGGVLAVAQAAYDVRDLPSGHLDPARLAVLSDALEDAGCTDADLLAHLRSPGPHVRGCWALDLILGKL